ncbi:hypothetical protein [Halorussus salinus]|uniref:hypothetical protein n=1 Tax=Halorussus salinus TaxID=1364935 RepID=UPI001092D4B1|nr:hypothetical protein [Halorussus salinus]
MVWSNDSSTFDEYIAQLKTGETEKVTIPKDEVPELPEYFEEHAPANELQEDGALRSYRDDEPEDSVHVIEYEDCWKVHLDDHNPRHRPVKHLVEDAPLEAAGLVFVAALLLNRYDKWPFNG